VPAKLHFLRFEFKYVLRADLRREIESELSYFVQLDPYVGTRVDKKYLVRSLYFDDPSYSCYFAKVQGDLHRAKFRLRTYSCDPAEACVTFLEIKGRHNALVFKHRTPLARGAAGRFAAGEGGITNAIYERATEGQVLDRFRYEVARKQLRPLMLIDYQRRPYVSKYDAEFRLTFDDSLRATRTESLYPAPWETSREVMCGYTIMEVKFRHAVPSWFHRILQSYNLRRQSVSKICKGMEAWQLSPLLDT